ncbi:uncharacterized protein LOC113228973 isoform X2 [Hyposmocoma kahamanoa]|uniref:uncharacterized protein LOC113228973 isoform X2 n=1 Tax=Hyposmocoma kahamanoa TaxID=1477025 RepID=UPI000E6DA212|nr:uncharacterized protein LOC113228973 isoform X2 [Hyposmocoma kahamanoa]
MDHNMHTEQDSPPDNRSDDDFLLGPAESITVKNIICNKPKHPCDPVPKCPTTPCDPSTVRLQCCAKGVSFKLSCTKLPPDCNNPEARYECELVDEGNDIDYNIMASCDLKCERIQAIHSDHPIIIEDDSKVAHIKKLPTMVCSKDNMRKVTLLNDTSILNNIDAKNSLTTENLNNPLLTYNDKGQEENKTCKKESLVDQMASSFIEHHNKTVKIIKVAANDLFCLITNPSKDPSKHDNDLNYINAVIEFTKDTISAVTTHANKFINSDQECEDKGSKTSKPQSGSNPPETFDLASSNNLVESAKEKINNLVNKNIPDQEQSQNDNNQAQDDLTLETVILINESSQGNSSRDKVYATAKQISNDPSHQLTGTSTSLTNEIKNNLTKDVFENSSSYKILPPSKMDFESDEYNDDSDESAPSNIFTTLKDKIRAVFNDHNNLDNTSANSSGTKFSEDSDDDQTPKPVH